MNPVAGKAGVAVRGSNLAASGTVSGKQAANDVRFSKRKSAQLAGYITSEHLSDAIACVVCDTSSTGARLKVEPGPKRVSASDLPDRFTLVMTQYRVRTDVDCVVARRTDAEVGVRFTSSFRTTETAVRKPVQKARTR